LVACCFGSECLARVFSAVAFTVMERVPASSSIVAGIFAGVERDSGFWARPIGVGVLVAYRAALGFGVLSVTYPTRLETRTKESNMGASYWVAKPKSVMNVKAGFSRLIWDP
jgi:hypothetical protein